MRNRKIYSAVLSIFTALLFTVEMPESVALASASYKWKDCFVGLDGREFTAGNSLYARTWRLGDGEVIPVLSGVKPAADAGSSSNWTWTVSYSTGRDSPVASEAMIAELTAKSSECRVKYRFRIFDNVPAIEWRRITAPGSKIPSDAVMDSFKVPDAQSWTFTAVQFKDATDGNGLKDNLVEAVSHRLEGQPFKESANIAYAENSVTGEGIVFLKLAPLPHARAVKTEYDFAWDGTTLSWHGPGVNAVSGEGYACATISYSGARAGRIAALQDYFRSLREYKPDRDGLLLSNTWGDRNRDSKISGEFLLKEIEAGRKLGVDVMQIDDGWQKGTSVNSSTVTRSESGVWSGFWKTDTGFWTPHPARLPNGLAPLAGAAESAGMHLGLWYAPDSEDEFANWEKDAARILELHRKDGVDFFKLDSITMKTARAEWNVKQMLDRIIRESEGRIVTDLDVTASVRPGYFGAVEAGAVFVENRYTEWKNYWPHWTLRNFWSLAEYVDPIRLRMEFLNNTRNVSKYKDDPLAPAAYPPAYLFASIMFGSPLAWFEVSELPEAFAADAGALVNVWRQHRSAIQSGHIIPIGNEPDGHQWTGFASIARDRQSGYLLVLRELTDNSEWSVPVPLVGEADGQVELLSGDGKASFENGTVSVNMPEPQTYLFMKLDLSGSTTEQDAPEDDYGPKPLGTAKAMAQYKANLETYKGNTNVLVLPGLVADLAGRKVEVLAECTGLDSREAVEFLLIDTTSSHGYEAMLWSHARPSDVHRALLFIGLQPGTPFSPGMLRFWADGDRVNVEVIADGGDTAFPIEQMILDTETDSTLPEEGFVFTGSMMVDVQDGSGSKYAADVYDPKSVASIYNEPTAVLDVPRQVSQGEAYERQVVNPDSVFEHGKLLKVVITPADTDGESRPRHFKIAVDYTASTTSTVCRLIEKEGETVVSAGSISEIIRQVAETANKERVPFVQPVFSDNVPLSETARICAMFTVVEGMGIARIDPPAEGQFYYRAFTPDKEWQKPEGRPTQPWELHLDIKEGKVVGEMVWYEPVWSSGSIEPTYTKWAKPASTPEVFRKELAADAKRREDESLSPLPPVLLVFADAGMTYGQVARFLRPVSDTHKTVYVFTEGE